LASIAQVVQPPPASEMPTGSDRLGWALDVPVFVIDFVKKDEAIHRHKIIEHFVSLQDAALLGFPNGFSKRLNEQLALFLDIDTLRVEILLRSKYRDTEGFSATTKFLGLVVKAVLCPTLVRDERRFRVRSLCQDFGVSSGSSRQVIDCCERASFEAGKYEWLHNVYDCRREDEGGAIFTSACLRSHEVELVYQFVPEQTDNLAML
jgi:hypothetical protein